MTATLMPQRIFSRSGMSVSQEESPGFSRGEDVNNASGISAPLHINQARPSTHASRLVIPSVFQTGTPK
jgi:hypothetical protein